MRKCLRQLRSHYCNAGEFEVKPRSIAAMVPMLTLLPNIAATTATYIARRLDSGLLLPSSQRQCGGTGSSRSPWGRGMPLAAHTADLAVKRRTRSSLEFAWLNADVWLNAEIWLQADLRLWPQASSIWPATVQSVHAESDAEFYRQSCAGAQFILRRLNRRGPLGGPPPVSPGGGSPPGAASCLSS